MLRILGKACKWKYVQSLWDEMIKKGIKPINSTYGTLIDVYSKGGLKVHALCWLGKMSKIGMQPDEVTTGIVLQMYKKAIEFQKAEEFFNKNCMINLYSERSMVTKAEAIFESMKQRREANEFTFAMMLCMYKKNGRFEEATQIAKQMREMKILTDPLSYNSVLGLFALDGRFKEAVETFKLMVSSGIQPDDSKFKSLGTILMKLGMSKKAVRKIEEARKMENKRGLDLWISTLSSLVGIEDRDDEL